MLLQVMFITIGSKELFRYSIIQISSGEHLYTIRRNDTADAAIGYKLRGIAAYIYQNQIQDTCSNR